MKRLISLVFAGSIAMGGLAFAQQVISDPTAKARNDAMKAIAASMKTLSDMAGAKVPFDAAGAQTAAATLKDKATQIPVLFEKPATDPASKASPKVWQDWDGFLAHAKKLQAGTASVDPTSAETLKATLGAAGGECRECHTAFRL